ncbi:unnamed protein product [Cuscuta europaea]|uniref:Uncharacterized protein n=1 Tax=Cuscuta europaea TaxID=41803 RepID=A0A9P1EG26_CUSEU|nr:unnamed protein product [Cuscuta europaea]
MTKINLPMKYLGSSLHKGINRKSYCQGILQSFDKKLSIWKQKHLNFGGRLVLIKHVLNTLLLHILAVDTLPKAVSRCMEKRMAHFLWGTNGNKGKYHWIKWKDLCLPYVEGGLGLRSLIDIEKAYSLKLWWYWRNKRSNWAKFCHARYPRGDMIVKVQDSAIWRRICKIHTLGKSLCMQDNEGQLIWIPETNGRFTLASAFQQVKRARNTTFYFRHHWSKNQQSQVQVFQWKATL